MKYVDVPTGRQVSFYLAMEEHLAHCYKGCDFFFMWQVPPSVIFGRNQVIEQEVNLDYCRQHGIRIFRRKSGGGCVYADLGNVMLSMVIDCSNVGLGYNRFVAALELALRRMGINVAVSGRNDLLVAADGRDSASEGRKVSGVAYYQLPDRSIIHSTLLYDTDMANMVGSITPSEAKLLSKGIKSVRQRVTLLKEYTALTLPQVMDSIRQTLCRGEYVLTDEDMAEAERIERENENMGYSIPHA